MMEEEEGSRVGEMKFSSKEIGAVEPWEWN
jgi:hypothetical protein